jgi:hypothetical protein
MTHDLSGGLNIMMMKIRKVIPSLLFLCLLVASLLEASVPHAYAEEPWQAKYWNNKNLAGDPVLVRQESEINYDWGDGSPGGVHNDEFSARWKRTLNVSPGSYRFTATMDDGMRVWVDNNLIIDSWSNSQAHSVSAMANLGAGDHQVKVEYYEDGGKAVAKLRIDPAGSNNIQNWRGEYFNNQSLSGTAALVRNDDRIDFDWGGGSPASGVIGADNFSVRWTRAIDLEPGRYRWTTTTDDGVRLWVNGRLIIDKWFDQSAGSVSAETDVPGGLTDVRMEYYENAGGAVARLGRAQISNSTSGTIGETVRPPRALMPTIFRYAGRAAKTLPPDSIALRPLPTTGYGCGSMGSRSSMIGWIASQVHRWAKSPYRAARSRSGWSITKMWVGPRPA